MEIFVIIMCVIVTIAVLFFMIAAILYFVRSVNDNKSNSSEKQRDAKITPVEPRNNDGNSVEPDLTPSQPDVKKTAVRKEPAPVIKRQPEPAPVYVQPEPAPVYVQPEPIYQPVPEPTSVVTAPVVEGPSVAFGVSGSARKDFEEEYKNLPYRKKQWCDTLLKEIAALEKARVKEGKFARTVLQGQDTIAKLQFVKGEICLDCTIVNSELKVYGKASGTKIKPKPMRFKVTDEHQLDAAMFTLKVANQTALEARQKKRTAKKKEEKE